MSLVAIEACAPDPDTKPAPARLTAAALPPTSEATPCIRIPMTRAGLKLVWAWARVAITFWITPPIPIRTRTTRIGISNTSIRTTIAARTERPANQRKAAGGRT